MSALCSKLNLDNSFDTHRIRRESDRRTTKVLGLQRPSLVDRMRGSPRMAMIVNESADSVYRRARRLAESPGAIAKRECLAMLQRAVELGSVEASYALATWYLFGKHVPRDLKRAVALLETAARGRSPAAMFDLGVCFEMGLGVRRNSKRARALYLAAAQAGDLDGQTEIARCLHFGVGGRIDRQAAFDWYLRAARRGDVGSQYAVGRAYELGDGTKRKLSRAAHWYERAAQGGNGSAIRALKSMKRAK